MQTTEQTTTEQTTTEQTLSDCPLPKNRRPPRPRDYWIFDQVVRRGRLEVDVAEDLCLSQPRISQICKEVGAWFSRVHDECLPDVDEAELRAIQYLINLRLLAQQAGSVPSDENAALAVSRLLDELTGIRISGKSQELIGN